jgi:uncharacterized protein (DUF2237 family)
MLSLALALTTPHSALSSFAKLIQYRSVQEAPRTLSHQAMTEFYRGGYCRSGAADYGNHAVAGIVSQEFLDFTASQGNDLRVAGLSGGCKRCFCTSRWLEAYEAMKRGVISEKAVPKVQLNATHESALDGVDLEIRCRRGFNSLARFENAVRSSPAGNVVVA